MRHLNKTQRQIKEYNRLIGFMQIKDKFNSCYGRVMDKNKRVSNEVINSEFCNFCVRTRIKYRMGNNNNYYERMWKQEYNKLKKK